MNRHEIKKNRIAFKISTAVACVEKYAVVVQILEPNRFILFRDDSSTRGQPPISVTGHWRLLSNDTLWMMDESSYFLLRNYNHHYSFYFQTF